MPIGVREQTIYLHDMPATAWQLLWWLICNMDEHQEIWGGWRIAATGDMKKHRQWIGKCAEACCEPLRRSRRERRDVGAATELRDHGQRLHRHPSIYQVASASTPIGIVYFTQG